MKQFFASFECLTLSLFFIRLTWYYFKGGKEFLKNYLLITIVSLWALNFIAYVYFSHYKLFYLYHAFAPITITVFFFIRKKAPTYMLIALSLLMGIIILNCSNIFLFVSIYYLALGIFLYKSLIEVKQKGSDIQKSPVYFFLALSLFASFISLVLKDTNTNWHESVYLSYLTTFSLSIYSTTYLLIHVERESR
jgi:hypothetical protein